ncbi:MAG TPA: hypothetical protein VJT49_32020 [Amycolatopsis sp.]|uniref:Rv1733c family protein n=1 Tax=Amycolatopsis sp. TaxID=37632 RepID=UPI002B48DE5A|nr:hypothetical protein [Amycolatopsis sp.]HKS49659.1 hypothetical protein [Amycolatopsis sp.]
MPSATWLTRQWRLLRPGRNPLARRCDRIEAAVLILAVVLCLAAIPLVILLGASVHARQSEVARAQAAERHQAMAVTLTDVGPAAANDTPAAATTAEQTPVQWGLPDGGARTGVVSVASATPAGSLVPIWLDRNGDVTTAPMSPVKAVALASGFAVLAWIGIAVAVVVLTRAVRVLLDRSRAAAWSREWELFSRKSSRW